MSIATGGRGYNTKLVSSLACVTVTCDQAAGAHAWKAKGRIAAGSGDKEAVNLARADERLLQQLPLRVLSAVKQPIAFALSQRHRRCRPDTLTISMTGLQGRLHADGRDRRAGS